MTISLADAKNRLSRLLTDVDRTHERVTITRHGRAAGVLVSPEDLESLEETLDVLSNTALMEQIATTRAEIARGEIVDTEGILAAMAERRHREQRAGS